MNSSRANLPLLHVSLFKSCFALSLLCCASEAKPKQPHIVFLLADDLGWHDVSYHGSPEIPTPNIDALASSGIVLHNYYVQPVCTPSRGAFMTGRYPMRLGLQHFVIEAGSPFGLPLDLKLLPQYLKDLGYETHLVGKWHLGHYKKEYTPTYRGFDSFVGYWSGTFDYYDHTTHEPYEYHNIPGAPFMWGIDMHNGTKPLENRQGEYAIDLFNDVAIEIIEKHDTSKPLFLYYASPAPHFANIFDTIQVPPEYVKLFSYIPDYLRRKFAGLITKLDESVGKVFEALHNKGILEDTIFVFSSDNGGYPNGTRGEKSSNWPLRSTKWELFEGGVRVPAVIWSTLFNHNKHRVSTDLIHITDWLPTFYEAAGGDIKDLEEIDGRSFWKHLTDNVPTGREEILLNYDETNGVAGLMVNKYKLLVGHTPINRTMWYGTSGLEYGSPQSMDAWVWKDGSVVRDILEQLGHWRVYEPDTWRDDLVLNCARSYSSVSSACDLDKGPCLFDLSDDPCEIDNIAMIHPEIVDWMMNRLEEYRQKLRPALYTAIDPRADPKCHGFRYVSWLDEEHKSDCPYL